MSADVDRLANAIAQIHEVWAGFIEVSIAIYLLERQIGWPCVIPLILAIGMAALLERRHEMTH